MESTVYEIVGEYLRSHSDSSLKNCLENRQEYCPWDCSTWNCSDPYCPYCNPIHEDAACKIIEEESHPNFVIGGDEFGLNVKLQKQTIFESLNRTKVLMEFFNTNKEKLDELYKILQDNF